ncbi:hypothetical protein [Deinococcus humi]|uniref:Lipoprotein n=1 Tax=Deinococcus humi TaxID=662880 RepID=A0A7W8K2Q5_9DEIO|nr:hypothetical protein [Deinococcus humi]MBB5366498.1 hypothetical protein [Deinococcus humi]GGI66920.1 hypothetical protein GCM10008949_53970 [Deinococcus humi]
MHKKVLAAACLASALLACGQSSTTPTTITKCVTLATTNTSIVPGQHILLTNIEPATPPTTVSITSPNGAQFTLDVQTETVDGIKQYFVRAPFHPDSPAQGGTLTLKPAGSATGCEGIAIQVAPLPNPEAPQVKGAFGRYVDTLQAAIDAQASTAGLSRNQLQGDAKQLPADIGPLFGVDSVSSR